MGCDIHYVVERRHNGRWVGLFSKWPRSGTAGDRDYAVFAELAMVRGSSDTAQAPRFLPADISELGMFHAARMGPDGHTHSWLPLAEFCAAYQRVRPGEFVGEWNQSYPWNVLFGTALDIADEQAGVEDYRVVFWFDN